TVLALYRECARQMKAVNPDIKVGGPALCAPVSWAVRDFLEACGDAVDFVSWHDYPTGSAETTDEALLLRVTEGKRFLPATRAIERVLDELGRPELPLFMDEFHINYAAWKPRDTRTATQFSAVFAASVFANLHSTRLASAMIHDLVSANYGLLGPASRDKSSRELGLVPDSADADPIHVRPVGWVYRWFNQLVRGEWVDCRVDLPPADASGPRGPLLDACAWADAGQWGVLLVNKDTAPHDVALHTSCPVHAEGFALPMTVYTLACERPCEAAASGTRDGTWRTQLPPMSVTFVAAPRSPAQGSPRP
ncbi:MAG: hypothetical protein JXR94_09265, partial [Candidatus Hydrogenedentes bacterium]|nr:hypothetical protein [Candidatus Hydrogenedentota bacterium]